MFEQLKHMPAINAILRRPPGFYAAASRQIAQVNNMDVESLTAFQDARIARILRIASILPGYAKIPATQSLSDWPILAKSAIAGREADFCTRSILPFIPAATGGTTGQPLKLSRSWHSVAFEQATIDQLCVSRGINVSKARVAILRGDSIKPADDMKAPFWIDEGPARRIFSAHHLTQDTIFHYKAALRCFQPDILFCYPSSLVNLLALIGDDLSIHIPLIFSSSEMLSASTNSLAQHMFGSDVIDFYGHAERIACAWSLNGGGYRFLPAYGHVELVPAGPGLARLIATSLNASGQIFIRYDTGDLVRVHSQEPAILRSIALGILPFEGIEGRDSEFVELADGRRIIGLNHIPRGVDGAVSVQLRQASKHHLDVFVVAGTAYSPASSAHLMANIRVKFPASIGVNIIFVQRPVREKNGKAPLLLRAPSPSSIILANRPFNASLEYVA